jgi:multidrug efflux pump subunit AcrA (membrane-fusion protein)
MSDKRFHFVSYLLPVILAAAFASGACRSEKSAAPENLVVVNAPASGKVSRIFVAEGTNVAEKASLIEIVAPVVAAPAGNQQRESTGGENIQSEIKAAEERLQGASVELQRVEPLVVAGSAPQSHLDAARAEYQQAQERLDELRRRMREAPLQSSNTQAGNNIALQNGTAKVTIVAAPAAGNIRVISVRVGQSVKTGDPLATISASR